MEKLEKLLEKKSVKATAIRLLILRTLHEQDSALSLSELEAKLGTIDKSTIFRTLSLFADHHLIHAINDSSGQTKYAVCKEDCHCQEDEGFSDLHTHFSCERCQRTFCLRDIPVPKPELPEGFFLHSANYVVFGLCPECSRFKPKTTIKETL